MSKFNKGDRIRRIKSDKPWAPLGFETEVVWKSPEGNAQYLDKDGQSTYIVDDMWELVVPQLETEVKKFDPTRPVATRDGRKVRIFCTDLNQKDGEQYIAGAYTDSTGKEWICTWMPDGRYSRFDHYPERDLVNVPVKVTKWINMFEGHVSPYLIFLYDTKEEAVGKVQAFKAAGRHYLRTVSIEWEE